MTTEQTRRVSAKPIIFGPLPPPYGGVAVFMRALCRAARHDIRIWSYTGKRADNDDLPNVLYVDHRRLGHIRAFLDKARGARVIDSSHFHLEYPNPLLLPAWLLAKSLLGFQWIKVVHDGSLPARFGGFSRMQKWLFRRALASVDEIVAASPDIETWFQKDRGHSGPVSVIPTLLPTGIGIDASPDERLARILERFKAHQKRVCSIGASIPSYGFHNVVTAVEALRGEGRDDIGLLLVDGGFARDDDYLKRLIEGRDWVEIAPGVPYPQLHSVFESSDVFVRAFEHESYGLSRIDALWSGVPVIATNAGETRGMLVYEFGDVETLQSHLGAILDGDHAIDVAHWAKIFRSEAEDNLTKWLDVIPGKPNAD